MQRKTSTVPVFEAHLLIPNRDGGAVQIDFAADNLATAKACVQKQLGGGGEFVPSDHEPGATAALLVYHSDYARGEVPIGWIQIVNTPEEMTPKATCEQRLLAARAA